MINLAGRNRNLLDPAALWSRIDLNRRAAVLALLFHGLDSQVNCILTTRSGHISYAGDAALPGGKADSLEESPLEVARRESFEEIGLSLGLRLDPVITMPAYLSSRYLCVVPEVVWLPDCEVDPKTNLPTIIDPQLFSHEVLAAFPTPLSSFLSSRYHESKQENWARLKFNQHNFRIPVHHKRVGDPAYTVVWGLTANILIDIARLWYQREPQFEHREPMQVGDQELVEKLTDLGLFAGERPQFINFGKVLGRDSPLLDIRRVK